MKWLSIVAALVLLAQTAAAQTGVRAAAIPIVRKWTKFSDPQEGAFQVDVPQGWKISRRHRPAQCASIPKLGQRHFPG